MSNKRIFFYASTTLIAGATVVAISLAALFTEPADGGAQEITFSCGHATDEMTDNDVVDNCFIDAIRQATAWKKGNSVRVLRAQYSVTLHYEPAQEQEADSSADLNARR